MAHLKLEIPDSLRHRIERFAASGCVFRKVGELLTAQSWIAVMLEQGIEPQAHHPTADQADSPELKAFLERVRASVDGIVSPQPSHAHFLEALMASEAPLRT